LTDLFEILNTGKANYSSKQRHESSEINENRNVLNLYDLNVEITSLIDETR